MHIQPIQNFKPRKRKEGWQQFLTNKLSMLSRYREAQKKLGGRPIKTEHGNVAEAEFRKWLQTFLPKRFGVTSGYLITQAHLEDDTLRHFDVIIYDQLNCPVLWIDDNSDKTEDGKSKAIPVEYVHGIIEVKSNLTVDSLTKGLSKLDELVPYLEVDNPEHGFKRFLPKDFFSCLVFFEIKKAEEYNKKILDKLIYLKRGFYGAVIFSAEEQDDNFTGQIHLTESDMPISFCGGDATGSIIKGLSISDSVLHTGIYFSSMATWTDLGFSFFAFDLLALLSGTYRPGHTSSFHGLGLGIRLAPKTD